MKILVVDDSQGMRMVVKRMLQQCDLGNYETVEAGDGKQALQIVGECQPDLILSDWHMPEMDGLEFLEALREQGDNIPFGFITTECSEELQTRGREAGAGFFVSKPFTAADIQSGIEATVPS